MSEHEAVADRSRSSDFATRAAVFAGPSDMHRRCREFNWSRSLLGDVASWTPALRTAASFVVSTGFPALLLWGRELVQLYNDAYLPYLGVRHPDALGRPVYESFPKARGRGEDIFARVFAGETVTEHERRIPSLDNGDRSYGEMFVDVSYTPIRDDDGAVGGVCLTMTDVTRHVRARALEGELRAERERLRTFIMSAPCPLALQLGADLRFELVNAAFVRVCGGRDVTGMTPAEAFPELAESGIIELFDAVYRTGVPWVSRETLVRYDRHGSGAEDTWFDLRFEPVRDSEGRVIGVLNFSFEVTELVQARRAAESSAQALRESESRLRAIYDGTFELIGILAADGTVIDCNRAALAFADSTREEMIGKPIWETPCFAYTPGAPAVVRDLTRRAAAGEFVRSALQLQGSDGKVAVFDFSLYPVRDEWGNVLYVIPEWRDVTDRHAIEVERERLVNALERLLSESERARAEAVSARERSDAVLASIADAFYLLDRDWRFTFVNDAAEPLLQTTRDKLIGNTLWEMFPGVIGSPFEAPYREAMATGRSTSAEAYFPPLGTYFDVHTYPWSGGIMVHFRDIGARKAAEAERERLLADTEAARREAESANRAKSDFLAIMSHELRTPLNAIGGYAELMELGIRGPITTEQRADLARIQASQRHLLGLINGVLNYARVEAGAVHYNLEDVVVAEVLSTCEALIAPQVRARHLTMDFTAPPSDVTVRADAEKLQQIVLNLLSNAVKFTEPGGHVSLDCDFSEGAGREQVRVRVTDTGIGIAPDHLARVFEPFVQLDAKLTRPQEGTGLGLAISRDLARGMGGDLTAESTLGVGSIFTLSLVATMIGERD